jgi:Uma2 family endonuclease
MVTHISKTDPQTIYPESDGLPLADNTIQFRLIVTIEGGIDALYKDDPKVFVAGDLFWYPVEGEPKIRHAPDVMVVFGRPKGDRRSYKQWEEENIPPQVVFEIVSKSNSKKELETDKLAFYQRYGVEEYYIFNPNNGDLKGWLRSPNGLEAIELMSGWISPRLNIRFEVEGIELQIYQPNGERFLNFVEMSEQREIERQRAEIERQRAETERQRAQQIEAELEAEKRRSQALREQLRALGIDPDAL